MRFYAWQDSLQYCILGKNMCAKKVNVHAFRKTKSILNNIIKRMQHITLSFELYNPLCKTKAISQGSKRCSQTLWGLLGPNIGRKKYVIPTFLCFAGSSSSLLYM